MNKAIQTVWEVCAQFMDKPQYVKINKDKINKEHFETFIKEHNISKPKPIKDTVPIMVDRKNMVEEIYYELMAASVNYQYWYGKSTVRPNGSSATRLYQIMDVAFRKATDGEEFSHRAAADFFKWELASERFPNMENRVKHINEIKDKGWEFSMLVASNITDETTSLYELDLLLQWFPGFADDIFLKRAFLFFMQLNRRKRWYQNCIHEFPIPADYQVPKVLEWMGIIKYEHPLKSAIKHNMLLAEGSIMECEIRAATILACRDLATELNITMSEVDSFLWAIRDECKNPFHLTATTWY